MKILDIGAFHGAFTDTCRGLFGNALEVVMVEANPSLVPSLEEKYKNNTNITVLNCVMAKDNNVLIDFYVSDAGTVSTASTDWITKSRFANQDGCGWHAPVKINSRSLDSLINEFGEFDVMKIDVEGYELEVLEGLTKKTKEICFEWAEEEYEKINKTISHLESLGYSEFGFIFNDTYMKRPDVYTSWGDSDFHNHIDTNRKHNWGMIWVK